MLHSASGNASSGSGQEPLRWILHLDMDAFFASVEQLDVPEYRGKPLIIGGESRGVVSTASYEARRFGIRSAMPVFQARKLCPRGIFIRPRMARYAEKSREVMEVVRGFSPLVEKASIDEAYLDLTGLDRLFGTVDVLARTLQEQVLAQTGLTCSLGVAPVKFLAKIASDLQKPAGLTILTHDQVPAFLETLPVAKIPGVGGHMQKKLEALGVRTAGEVSRYPGSFWENRLGKMGRVLYARCLGQDPRPVEPWVEAKSESAENTFAEDTRDQEILSAWLLRQSERVGAALRAQGIVGRTITLKAKFADFTQVTRSRTLKHPTNLTRPIYETALELLRELNPQRPLRLIGVGVSNFGAGDRQLTLLPAPEDVREEREAALDSTLDVVRERFGRDAIVRGKLFPGKK